MRGHDNLVTGGAEWRLLFGARSQCARFDRTIAWVSESFGRTACGVFCGMHAAPNWISQRVIVLRRAGVLSNPIFPTFYHWRSVRRRLTFQVPLSRDVAKHVACAPITQISEKRWQSDQTRVAAAEFDASLALDIPSDCCTDCTSAEPIIF